MRRAYRLLLADDPRPLPQRLTHEARRLLILAGAIVVASIGLVVAVVVALVVYAT